MGFIDYMETHLGEASWNSTEIEASWDCPFCTDTRGRFRMNKRKMAAICYNCEWKGNAVTFIRDYQKLSWADAFDIVSFYSDFTPLPQDVFEEVFDRIYLEGREVEVTKKYIPLPSDYKLLAGTASLMADPFRKYAKQRGLTDRQIELHGLGFCPEGEIKLANGNVIYLKNRLVTQVFDDDRNPLYWVGRALREDMKPKTFNPVGGTNTINKTDIIFNLNNAKKTGVAVITEGVFDATTVGDSGVALFGKTLNVKQLLQIIKADFKAVYVMLDSDATESGLKICDLLSKHIKNTYFCYIKEGDPNEVGKRGCLEAIKSAERYDRLTRIKYQLLR